MGGWNEQGEDEKSKVGLFNGQAYESYATLSLIPLFSAL
jgi:hypothetical protein